MKVVRKFLIHIRHGLRKLVSTKVTANSLDYTWHYDFIKTHILAALAALVSLSAYTLVYGWPDYVVLGGIGLLILPIAIAVFLSYSGNIKQAQFLSSINLVFLAGYAAAFTGGVSSFLLPWLAIAPFEAALSGSRRIVVVSLLITCLTLASLFGLEYLAMLPSSRVAWLDPNLLHVLGISSATIYAGGLALMIHKFNMLSKSAIIKGERRYRLVAENATDMITRHSSTGAVTFISGSAQRLFGCESRLLLGNGLMEHIHPQDRAEYLQSFALVSQTRETVAIEFRIGYFDGNRVEAGLDDQWVEMRCRPLTRSNDRLTSLQASEIVAVTRDVTERKKQQMELKNARDDAENALLAKTSFLAGMSHELRTPLNAIIGFSEVLQSQAEIRRQGAAEQEYIGLIHSSGVQLLKLVNSLLDMSKIEFGKMELNMQSFDFASVVRACIKTSEPMGKDADVKIICAPGDDAIPLVADDRACRQIVLNLLSNAVKFSKPGGLVKVSFARNGDFAELVIEDQGIGIPDDVLPKLTEPFAKVDNTYGQVTGGSGLGLSIARGLIKLHGGSLELESKLGTGTHVTVKLPLEAGMQLVDRKIVENEPPSWPEEKISQAQNG